MTALKERFEGKFIGEPNSGCWLWMAYVTPAGYGKFGVKNTVMLANRASWEIYRGKIPDGLFVLHKCDTPACVNPNHLFLGTQNDNMRDKYLKGRARGPSGPNGRHGEKNPLSKLTETQVEEIRASSDPQRKIAARYGISQRAVSDIRLGRRWRHSFVST